MNKIEFPVDPVEQNIIAENVPCPFCNVQENEPCVKGLIFPQYPHHPRLQLALVKFFGWTEQDIRKEYFGEEDYIRYL